LFFSLELYSQQGHLKIEMERERLGNLCVEPYLLKKGFFCQQLFVLVFFRFDFVINKTMGQKKHILLSDFIDSECMVLASIENKIQTLKHMRYSNNA
jgi:hypothetical protein